MRSTKPEADIHAIQWAIRRLVQGSRKTLIADAGAAVPEMTPAAFVIMTRVVDMFPVSPAAVIAVTGLDRSVVSRNLTALTKQGYVVSESDPDDGRVSLFSPTPDAAAKFGEASRVNRDRIAAVIGDWSPEDVSTFVTLLERFNKSAYES
ncbi:MarR family winged helix-turn-helix transcriptional regulator [Rhodococcus globerulus]|uniref:MarR family winged helix-turn-helix transcriptional regulator n=1 Tax=Rhodococcus TaxID=1827 RepID=UPI00121C5E5B|nr:MarR family winged helix-turn-helix transcriptional regulator [Rhodococcus sp. (in: high G+C Gram-positive bacteria)]RZL24667.1 MAG: MarR family transcriptional regulator [Rhodococcus sp. (in: high G+C Gram-positive bacteria)]